MLKAVFFDAAGTLFDARDPVGHTYARIARKHGLTADDVVVSAGFRRAFSSSPGLAFGPGHDADELRRRERQWWYRLVRKSFDQVGEFKDFDGFFAELFGYFGEPASWVPLPQAHSVLQGLKETDLKLGVISNFDYRLYRILDGLELRPFFDTVTISSEAGFAKPSREIFAAALSATRVDCAQALHIGDSEALDVRGAQAAGLRAIHIDVRMPARRTIDGSGMRVSSLAEVIEVVRFT
jgi:putative hydrolase of the HAD superfamily